MKFRRGFFYASDITEQTKNFDFLKFLTYEHLQYSSGNVFQQTQAQVIDTFSRLDECVRIWHPKIAF